MWLVEATVLRGIGVDKREEQRTNPCDFEADLVGRGEL